MRYQKLFDVVQGTTSPNTQEYMEIYKLQMSELLTFSDKIYDVVNELEQVKLLQTITLDYIIDEIKEKTIMENRGKFYNNIIDITGETIHYITYHLLMNEDPDFHLLTDMVKYILNYRIKRNFIGEINLN
jgi:hypothetical protein